MATKKKIAIVGLGNVGKAALDALLLAPDLELAGVVRRKPSPLPDRPAIRVAASVEEFGQVDGAILCGPTRLVGEQALALLEKGISTVDSFDIHGEGLLEHRARLDGAARSGGAVALISAGWDPGSDSVIRALMEAMAPKGKTHTTFGPGMSMGHSVAAKAIEGVRDAVSMTLPAGPGTHKRQVFLELEPGADRSKVEGLLREDPYFASDETEVVFVESAAKMANTGHGVRIEREGSSGSVGGQRLEWNMRIDNPALTGQMMVSAIRAAFRQLPGCYSLIEIPPVDFLAGSRDAWVRALV